MRRWLGSIRRPSLQGRELALGLLSLLAGALLGGGLWWDDIETLAQLRQQAQALAAPPAQGVGGQAAVALAAPTESPAILALPEIGHAERVWPWLQQRLQAHGLQVLSLRPGAPETQAAWPTQALALEVQGRWPDWQDFERQLHRHAPWWTVSQWQLAPLGQTSGMVRVQWQVRLAWRPAAAGGTAPDWPQWTAGERAQDAVPVFAVASPLAPTLQALPLPAAVPGTHSEPVATALSDLSPDPMQWPVQTLRLYGTWRQAGSTHAVLGQGPFQVVLTLGQRVGREGHRLVRIGEDGVVLQPADASQSPFHLNWSGGRR